MKIRRQSHEQAAEEVVELLQTVVIDDEFYQSEVDAGLEIEIPDPNAPDSLGVGGGEYVPRLSVPAKDNPYYITKGYGSLNECILGSPQYSKGSALSNCVGYAWGRAYELLDSRPRLSRANAEDWWAYNDGYKRGQVPKLGAIACWRKGKAGYSADGAGHVAVCEVIEGGNWKAGQSGYGSSNPYWLTTYQIGSESHGAYTFQGFIYIDEWENPKKEVLDVDGSWGTATTRYTQIMLGTVADGIVSSQPSANKKYLPNCHTSSWKFVLLRSKGSQMVRTLQNLVGANVDGKCGKQTVTAIQKYLKARGYYDGALDGSMGPATVRGWQRYVNAYFKQSD